MTDSQKLDLILEKVGGLDEKVDSLDLRVSSLEEKVTHLDRKVDSLGLRLSNLEEKVTHLDQKVSVLDKNVACIKTELQDVKEKVTKVHLVIENELRVNIQRVAEGHLDLSRNLHEAMKPSNEVEILTIRVRMLETDVKALKDKIS